MCGLVGYLDPRQKFSSSEASHRLDMMSRRLRHRGPDGQGTAVESNDNGKVWGGLGHRRLSVLDLSPTGAQPMQSHCGRYIIAFNGEIYNFREIRHWLDCQAQIKWRGTSDTEVLLELVARVGVEKALDELDGMFAFAVLDLRNRRLSLARDAFGEKPLYYGLWDGVLLFGSELRALAAWPGFRPAENEAARAAFFRYSYIPAPETIYERVWKLPAAHWLELSLDQLSSGQMPTARAWWDSVSNALQSIEKPFQGDFETAVDAVSELLSRSVRRRMVSDVPLGALLSGGVDSSLTTAIMQQVSDTPVRTFTIGMSAEGYDESPAAEAVANHLGTRHETLMLTAEDVLSAVPDIGAMYDEPFADSSQLPTFLVARMAREQVTVALSGDGGDELFAGYNRHFRTPGLWDRLRHIPRPARSIAARGLRTIPPSAISRLVRMLGRIAPAELAAGRAGEKLHKLARLMSASNPEELHELLLRTDTGIDRLADYSGLALVTERADPRAIAVTLTERLMLFDTENYLPDDILTKVDRASMSVSLEIRTPYLDRELFSLAWSLPLAMKANDQKGKRVLRELLYRHVPPHLIDRPKAGFAIPVGRWLRGPLREWAETLLESEFSKESMPKIPLSNVQSLWLQHLSGKRDHATILWNLLMYRSWQDSQPRLQAS